MPQAQMLHSEVTQDWKALHTLVKVIAKRQVKGKKMATETRDCISSDQNNPARYYNALVRGHWGIENHLHWHLDMTFKEDASKVNKDLASQNLSALRKIALQRLTQMKDKLSLPKRRFRAAMNLVYLENILSL